MEEAHLQGNSALLAQVECLQLPVGGPVPHVDAGAIQTWNTSRGAVERWSATVKTPQKSSAASRLVLPDVVLLWTHLLPRGPRQSRWPGL